MLLKFFFKTSFVRSIAVIAIVIFSGCSSGDTEKTFREGKALLEAKNFKNALEKFTVVIDEADADLKAQAYYQRALTKEELGDTKGAIADYSEAVQIDKNDYESWHNRGILKDNLGDANGAIEDYSQAISINDNRYEAYLNRGVAYSNLSKKQLAAQDFQYAVRRNPRFARAWYFLALTKHDLRDTTACGDAKNAAALGLAEAGDFLKKNCGDF